jgi:hypothetical protein
LPRSRAAPIYTSRSGGPHSVAAYACYRADMSHRKVWEQVYQRFDVYERVTSAAWRADRPLSPAHKIVEILGSPFFRDARILVTGTIGTGKTTELLRVVEARSEHEFVVFLDLARHFDRLGRIEGLQHVSQWEVCFLIGLALYRAAEDKLELPFPKGLLDDLEKAWSDLARTSGTPTPAQLDLGKLGKAIITAGAAIVGGPAAAAVVSVAGPAAEALRSTWNIPMGASSQRIPDDDEQVKTMLNTVNRVIAEIQSRHRPVLLVIDGLDRIRDIERARALFVESDVLARLACRVVICGPFALRHHPTASAVPRFQFLPLVNEPVLDQHDPTRPGPGLPFFTELFLRRTKDLGGAALIAQPLLDHLAFYSGGRSRDFVKMINMVAQEAWHGDADTASEAIVENVIDQERRLLETGLHRGHIDVLETVIQDPDHRLPHDELVWELLTLSKLLPYPDHSEWFYPHPLLTRHLLNRAGSTS